MSLFSYVLAAILGAALCVMVGANAWRWVPVIEMIYAAALLAGGVAGCVVLAIFTTYEKRVIEPMRKAVEIAEKVAAKAAESHRTGGNNG